MNLDARTEWEVAKNKVLAIQPGNDLIHERGNLARVRLGSTIEILSGKLSDQDWFAKCLVPQILRIHE